MVTPDQAARIQALRRVARLLDSAFRVPGTSMRIGLDPLIGLVPGIGDLVSPLFAIVILLQARALGLPRVVQLRMLINVGLDALVGAVPFFGDLFDFAWKANENNLRLLEDHVFTARRQTAGDWAFVVAMIGILLGIAIAPFVMVAWVISRLT